MAGSEDDPKASGEENAENTEAEKDQAGFPGLQSAPLFNFNFADERIADLLIEEEMRDSYLTYAMSTIVDRALPDIRDGLKPSQRRVMIAMHDLHLGPRSKHRKCAKIAGDTSGNYHPHGESVVYPTLVRLGQDWNMRLPLVDPQGNFGSIDGDPPAAMRYTEARMTAAAIDMLEDIQYDTVDMQANYDDTRTEPTVLPAKLPNLLINGSQGIAVGMATSLPPHNPGEVCDALIHLIDHPEAELVDLMKFIKGPDFPTGGLLCGRKGIIDGYTTGRGRLILRAKLHTEQARGGKTLIVVDEIPYQVLKTTIIERIADTVKNDKIPDISNIEDHSDRTGMRIVVELKKGAEPELVINQLYQYTPLQSTFSIINIALVNKAPRTLTLREMLFEFLEHRKEVIRRRTTFLLRRARQRGHLLEGLILAVADIDEIIRIIRTSPDVPTARARLMAHSLRLTEQATVRKLLPKAFVARVSSSDQHLTSVQADHVLSMQLQRLTGLEIKKVAEDYSALSDEIDGYELILGDERRLMDVIREDMREIREKYKEPRRTQIIGSVTEFDIEDLIAEEDVVVTISHDGYIKRTPLTTYRKQGRGGMGIIGSEAKEGDFIERIFVASTHDYLLFFMNNGRMYWLKVYDIPSMARQSKGRAIINLLEQQKGEKIASVLPVRTFDENHFLFLATQRGQVKKTELSAYGNPRRGGIQAIALDKDDTVIGATVTGGKDEIVLATREGMSIRFAETDARGMGRATGGVRGIHLREGDEVVDMAVVEASGTLLTVCEFGFGKRTEFGEYRVQSRGGTGLINIRTARNGKVVGARAIHAQDELMLITEGGMVVRIGLEELRTIGRATQGVKLINLKEGDKVVAIAPVENEDKNMQ